MKRIVVTFLIAVTCFLFVTTNAQNITGTYAIKNVKTGIFIRIKDANTKNGTPIVAYSPVNWKCVTWDFKKQEGNVYQLKNLFSGKTLQPKGSVTQGVSLEEQPITDGNATQQYEFVAAVKTNISLNSKGLIYTLRLRIIMVRLMRRLCLQLKQAESFSNGHCRNNILRCDCR